MAEQGEMVLSKRAILGQMVRYNQQNLTGILFKNREFTFYKSHYSLVRPVIINQFLISNILRKHTKWAYQ